MHIFGCLPPLDIRVPDDFGGEEWESRWEEYVACGAAVPERPDHERGPVWLVSDDV